MPNSKTKFIYDRLAKDLVAAKGFATGNVDGMLGFTDSNSRILTPMDTYLADICVVSGGEYEPFPSAEVRAEFCQALGAALVSRIDNRNGATNG